MEKRKNGCFIAVSVLSFIIGTYCFIDAISIFIEMSEGLYLDGLEDIVLASGVLTLLSAVYAIVQGVNFIKYSSLTNEQASKCYKRCVVWTVFSFIFTGLLCGILAVVGLKKVVKVQKQEFEGFFSVSNEQVQEPIKKELTVEELERAKDKLEKLNELKLTGAITDEEYAKMRSRIMEEINPTIKPQVVSDPDAERLAKLQELRSSGAITEEEFNALKNRILNKR